VSTDDLHVSGNAVLCVAANGQVLPMVGILYSLAGTAAWLFNKDDIKK
jgi:hypothetical protein